MTKAKVIMIVAFLVTFAAGVAAGLAYGMTRQHPHDRSWLSSELNLTPEQRDKMSAIWTEVMHNSGEHGRERRQALQKQRDDAVRALLTEPQKAQYESVLQDYSKRAGELSKEREKLFQEAVERTKLILTDEQRKKYEELLKNRLERERHPAPPSGGKEPRIEEHGAPQSGT